MLLRLYMLIGAAASLTTGTAFAQLDVRVQLIRQSDIQSPNGDSRRLEDFDLVIIIVNDTSTAVEVPKTYPQDGIRLYASGSNGTIWPLCLGFRHPASGMAGAGAIEAPGKKTVKVAPGDKYEVLRVSARETLISPGNIYAEKPVEEFTDRRWEWGWAAHRGPDYSPFETRKGDRRSDTAVLWCELDVDGKLVRSVPQLVKLRQ